MSYCRFSNNDYQCDVYCYASVSGGYVTHVASNRPILDGTLPPPVPWEKGNDDAWFARHEAVMAWMEKAERKPIGLPYDGESFDDPAASDAADRLQMLKDAGYNVPQYAIDALREEAGEQGANVEVTGVPALSARPVDCRVVRKRGDAQ